MLRLILILVFILLAFFYASDQVTNDYKTKRKHYIQIVILLLILQSGLRNVAVGSDTYQYFLRFQDVKNTSWQNILNGFITFKGKDPFYSLFQKSVQVFSTNFQVYLLLVAVIFMSTLGYFIYDNTTRIRHALLAFIIYMGNFYGFFSITGIRQTLATAMILMSFHFIKEKKLFWFTLLVLIAGFFHVSAFIFFPLYFIGQIKQPKLILGLAFFGFPLVMIFKNQLAAYFVSTLNMEDRFGMYAEQYVKGGSIVLTAFHVILAFVGLRYLKKTLSIAPRTYLMFNTFAMALFFFPLQWVNPSAGRVAQYFTIIMLIWIPYLLDAASLGKPKLREFLYFISITFLIVVTLFAIDLNEYRFFWQRMQLPKGY
jgi:EpsG family